MQARAAIGAAMLPPPPGAAAPDVPLKELAGCYFDFAYGNFSLALSSDGASLTADTPQFGAGANFKLSHYDGNVFNATLSVFQPSVNGSELYLRGSLPLQAEFGIAHKVVDGLAFNGANGGLWVAQGGIPEPTGTTPKGKAEVWFQKTKCPK